MNLHGPILVALDGSASAERAATVADAVASALRTHLTLVTVLEDSEGVGASNEVELERLGREYSTSYLNGVRTRLGRPEARTIVRVGNPTPELLACADECHAGIIAISTHGRSGVGRWVYGSIASNLLHRSHAPLLVIGPHGDRSLSGGIKHIAVPLDGSEVSEDALAAAKQLRDAAGARISLVRIVKWAVEAYPYTLPDVYVPQLDTELEQGARAYLDRQREAVGGNVSTHVIRGAAADSLIDFVDREQVDLVVMSTHGRGGIGRAALGSTADRLLQCKAPVLLIPARERASARPSLEHAAVEAVLAEE